MGKLVGKLRRVLWTLVTRALRTQPRLVDAVARIPWVLSLSNFPYKELMAVEVRRPELAITQPDTTRIRTERVRWDSVHALQTPEPVLTSISTVTVCPTCNSVRQRGQDQEITVLPAATLPTHKNTDYRTTCIYSGKSNTYYHANSYKNNRLAVPEGISGLGFMGSNWFHFINEILPRAVLGADEVGNKNAPVLVAERNLDGQRMEILSRLVKNPITICPFGWEIECDLLHQHSGMMTIPTRRLNRHNMLGDLTVSMAAIDIMRERLLVEFYKTESARDMPKRVALARKQYTRGRAINLVALHELFEERGCTRVFLEDLTFEDQVSLMAQAESVVGVTGAAWSLVWLAQSLQEAILIAPNPKFLPFQVLASLVCDKVQMTSISELEGGAVAHSNRE